MVGNRIKRIAAGLVVVGALAAPSSVLAHGKGNRNVNRRAAAVECDRGERVVTEERRRNNGRTRVVARCEEDERTKTKTVLTIAGGAATGAGVGAVVDGAKGALIGAAIGGGAASIYEAAKRR
jgi:hypothetical protein